MATPWNWDTENWGEYKAGKNDFSTKITELAVSGNTAGAAAVELLRNNYINSDSYKGKQKETNLFSSGAAAADSIADKAAEKVEKVIKTATVSEDPEEEKTTKVIYSAFDPTAYNTITPESASETGGKILGYSIVAIIGLVIFNKLFG